MPTLSATQPALEAEGPLLPLQIVPPRALIETLQARGEPVPKPVSAIALIDTGASATCMQTGTAAKLGLKPVGIVTVSTPSSESVECHAYAVDLALSNGEVIDGVTVIEVPLKGQSIECILGRDVLAKTVFVYTGPTNSFSISF